MSPRAAAFPLHYLRDLAQLAEDLLFHFRYVPPLLLLLTGHPITATCNTTIFDALLAHCLLSLIISTTHLFSAWEQTCRTPQPMF